MFSLFKKKKSGLDAKDTDIVAIVDGRMISLEEVKDEVFSNKMMGDGVAFVYSGDTVYSPCNGEVELVFPTGHAFGLRMKDGTGLLIHIGIDTVNGQGDGFKSLVKQGQIVTAGEELVKLDRKKLDAKYDMTTMLLITEESDKAMEFVKAKEVKMGEKINC